MSASKKKKSSALKKWLAYIVMLLTGSGVGGYQLRDYPMIQKALHLVLGEEIPEDSTLKDVAREQVTKLIKDGPSFRESGVYEVRVAELRLDPAAYRNGQTVDLQVQIRSVDTQGKEKIVWKSSTYGERLAKVGKDDLSASWKDRPFLVGWSPGDQLFAEVVSQKVLRDSVAFRSDAADKDTFPLAPGTHKLVCLIPGAPVKSSQTSQISLEATRVSDRPVTAADQVAERPTSTRR